MLKSPDQFSLGQETGEHRRLIVEVGHGYGPFIGEIGFRRLQADEHYIGIELKKPDQFSKLPDLENLRRSGHEGQIDFIRANGLRLPLETGAVDEIVFRDVFNIPWDRYTDNERVLKLFPEFDREAEVERICKEIFNRMVQGGYITPGDIPSNFSWQEKLNMALKFKLAQEAMRVLKPDGKMIVYNDQADSSGYISYFTEREERGKSKLAPIDIEIIKTIPGLHLGKFEYLSLETLDDFLPYMTKFSSSGLPASYTAREVDKIRMYLADPAHKGGTHEGDYLAVFQRDDNFF